MSSECRECSEHVVDCKCMMENTMEWQNIREEIPRNEIRILLCDVHRNVFIGSRHARYDEFDMFEIEEQYEDDDGQEIDTDILFWRELPDAPEKIVIPFHEYSTLKTESFHLNDGNRVSIFRLKIKA